MKHFTLLSTFLFFSLTVAAQILKGSILKSNGEPVPFASVYIHETTAGIVADEQGRFQTRLNTGTYTCEFRSLGYESQTKTIEIKPEGTTFQITLAEKEIKLNELLVKPSKDNPANRVMRQAIAHAPQHLYQVSSFSSENYMKGSAKIEKLPTLMKMMIKDKKFLSLVGRLLVLESKNQVTFQSPAKYTQKVIAYKSSIPKEFEPKGGFQISTSSIYQSYFMGYISPLSTKAFQYYLFKLEDIYTNGAYTVNKIKITPKLQSEKLMSGYIYILEDNWSVFSLDFNTLEMGSTTNNKITYQEIKPTVFLPITFDSYMNIGTMGVKGYGRYYSSVKYNDIKLNGSIAVQQNQQAPTTRVLSPNSKSTKSLAKIAKLSAKENLKTREAIELARLMAEETKPQETKNKSLEIKDDELVKMEVDSMSAKRDSSYWEEIRNVPLRADEAESFKQNESLKGSKSIKTDKNSISMDFSNSNKSSILTGGKLMLGKTNYFRYNGLLNGCAGEYNFVDGLWLGQSFAFFIRTTKTNTIKIEPELYYTTARHSLIWNLNNSYQYAPLANGKLSLALGNTSEDIQEGKGASRLFNYAASILTGDNVIRFYQKKYISIENQIDLYNGLRLTVNGNFEDRTLLTNNTNYHSFGHAPLPNYPDQAYSDAFPNHTSMSASLKLEYTPFMKYRIKDSKKEYAGSAYPSFVLKYKKAIPLLNGSQQSNYDKVDVSMFQNIKVSEFDQFSYQLAAGTFLSKQKLYAPDFNYFTTMPLLFSDKMFDNSFTLLPNYSNSQSKWLMTAFNYKSKYLLLKRIPFLQTKLFTETLHLKTLWNEQKSKPYSEIGYSIGIGSLYKVGIFSSFNQFRHVDTGIKISIPLLGMNWNK